MYTARVMLAFLFAALAQDEVCAPLDAGELLTQLGAVESALLSLDVDAARGGLDRAREAARCLSTPVNPADLGRLAWAEAEVAAASMDAEIAWQWIRLAREAGAKEPPSRITPEHALRVVLADEPDAPPVSGPTGVHLYAPKKGAVYADGRVITEPALTLSTPHLVQVFDRDELYVGTWQLGASFPTTLLVADVTGGRRDRAVELNVELPPPNWKPKKANTEEAYKAWIKKHPDGPWLQAAMDGIDDLDWAAAVELGTELAARQYLHDHPEGLHVNDALFAIEHLAYQRVMAAPNRQAWNAFLAETPDGSYALEARLQLDMLDWKDARSADDAAAYKRYREAQPNGRYHQRAAELEEERAFDEARAKATDTAIERFLEHWPNGRFADEARAMSGSVKFDSLTLQVAGDAEPAVLERVLTDLRTEIERRKVPVVTAPAADSGRLHIEVRVVPRGTVTDIRAELAVDFGELERPLFTLRIESTMLPTDDAGARLGELLVTNLRPFDRWRNVPDPPPLPPKPAPPAPAPAPNPRKR